MTNQTYTIRKPERKNRLFALLACIMICGGGQGVLLNSISIFIRPVSEALGFSRAQFSAHNSIVLILSTAFLPLMGSLFPRPYFKRLMLLSAVVCSLVPFGFALSTKLWQFYALAVILGFLIDGVSMPLAALIANNWFPDKKGSALGVTFAGSGIAATGMVRLSGYLMDLHGWQAGYLVMGALALLLLLPPALLFQVYPLHPQWLDGELSPSGAPDAASKPVLEVSYCVRDALRTPQFYCLVAISILIGICTQGTNAHSAAYVADLGLVSIQNALPSLIMLLSVFTKIIGGGVFDRIGARTSVLITTAGIVTANLLLIHILAFPPAYIAVALGVSIFMSGGVVLTVLVERCFGMASYSQIYTIITSVSMLGLALGGVIPGAIFDQTGSYVPAWYLICACALLNCALYLFVIRRNNKELAALRAAQDAASRPSAP